MLFLSQNGSASSRTTAGGMAVRPRLDRQRHGHLRRDLADVIEALDLRDVTLVGHSTGGGEVARYIGRHGTARVSRRS